MTATQTFLSVLVLRDSLTFHPCPVSILWTTRPISTPLLSLLSAPNRQKQEGILGAKPSFIYPWFRATLIKWILGVWLQWRKRPRRKIRTKSVGKSKRGLEEKEELFKDYKMTSFIVHLQSCHLIYNALFKWCKSRYFYMKLCKRH